MSYRQGGMSSGALFPIDQFPPLIKEAILGEFDGRCPSAWEIIGISDKYWLTLPHIGPQILKRIRSAAHEVTCTPFLRPLSQKSDVELLNTYRYLGQRIKEMQNEAGTIRSELRLRGVNLLAAEDGRSRLSGRRNSERLKGPLNEPQRMKG
jgi:hypothetical protein